MANVAKPYAGALYEAAIENGNLDAVYMDVFNVLGIFRSDPAFAALLLNPRILPEDKEAVILKALSGMDGSLSGLITLMLKKGRGAHIEAALKEFINLTKAYKGIVNAQVYSAIELTEEQLSALSAQLAAKTGKQIEIEAYVDPSIIGGLLINAGGMVLDNTIKKHLQTLTKRLA